MNVSFHPLSTAPKITTPPFREMGDRRQSQKIVWPVHDAEGQKSHRKGYPARLVDPLGLNLVVVPWPVDVRCQAAYADTSRHGAHRTQVSVAGFSRKQHGHFALRNGCNDRRRQLGWRGSFPPQVIDERELQQCGEHEHSAGAHPDVDGLDVRDRGQVSLDASALGRDSEQSGDA